MLTVKAKFIGQDSLGYENGKEYVLKFVETNTIIRKYTNDGKCKYGSEEAFFKNWTNVVVISTND